MTRVVAVTGASGYLGRPLVRRLRAGGATVRALVRVPERFVEPDVTAHRCRLPDDVDVDALAGVDVLVHAAWATRETDPAAARRQNEEGAGALLAAARRAGVGRVVFVSSIAARADAPSAYGRAKHAVEALLDPARDAAVRPGLVLAREGSGLFHQLLGAMRRLHVAPLFGGGRQPLQTVHVDDCTEAIARVVERGLAGVVHVAEPEPLAMRDFLRLAARRAGVRCVFVPVPFAPALAALRAAERLGVALPLRSESLLGLAGMRAVAVDADLARLGLRVRGAAESLADLLP